MTEGPKEDPKTGTLVHEAKASNRGELVEVNGAMVRVRRLRNGRIEVKVTGANSAKVIDQSTIDP